MNWDKYFIKIAKIVASKSKDPVTQVGCIIVDYENHIIGTGYNGMIQGVNEEGMWEDKHKYVIHAELNAILHSYKQPFDGATLYCTMFPCSECAKAIATVKIRRVVYVDDKYSNPHIKHLFNLCGIELKQMKG